MENLGFFRVAAAIPSVKVADCAYNVKQIEKLIIEAAEQGVKVVAFPELAITGYSCGDLFSTQTLKQECEKQLKQLIQATSELSIIAIIGTPIYTHNKIFNGAAVIKAGSILGVSLKSYIPKGKSQEQRWFSPAGEFTYQDTTLCGMGVEVWGNNIIYQFEENGFQANFSIEIGEDLWAPVPVSSTLAANGAEVIFNLSASNDIIGKYSYVQSLVEQQSARGICGYVYTSAGFGESSTDMVYGGSAIIAENGKSICQAKRFSLEEQLIVTDIDIDYLQHDRASHSSFTSNSHLSDKYCNYKKMNCNLYTHFCEDSLKRYQAVGIKREIDAHPFVPKGKELDSRCEEIFNIQCSGLAKRLVHTNCKSAVIGISGGLDSTLAILVAVKTFDMLGYDRKGIMAITMPGFGTTGRTYNNAIALMESLQVTIREISIKEACIQHFKDIAHNIDNHNVVYENSQARERTQILMDVANQVNGLVIGTGDLSELALGWATYNGDHMSMYGVNAGVPKTLVRSLVEWVAKQSENQITKETLLDIADTPISPELIPADNQGNIKQKTEDLVGPYELHDFFLYHFMRHGATPAKIYELAYVAFENEYDSITIRKWLSNFFRRFFNQQFKRSCLPDGPKIGSIGISPRGDWQMPSDAVSAAWLEEIEKL